jgi:hypothetical protein
VVCGRASCPGNAPELPLHLAGECGMNVWWLPTHRESDSNGSMLVHWNSQSLSCLCFCLLAIGRCIRWETISIKEEMTTHFGTDCARDMHYLFQEVDDRCLTQPGWWDWGVEGLPGGSTLG